MFQAIINIFSEVKILFQGLILLTVETNHYKINHLTILFLDSHSLMKFVSQLTNSLLQQFLLWVMFQKKQYDKYYQI